MSTKTKTVSPVDTSSREALRLHAYYRGKVQMLARCPVRSLEDFAIWYTPGVAEPCRAIRDEPELVYEHTARGNCVAVVSDGSRILGLGNIGPEAGLPVMEGKALLFKHLGGVDAVPLCVAPTDDEQFMGLVKSLQPSFGGINLEDIAQPRCFRILNRLREEMQIPVWHDDQQGSATVLLAGLMNALEITGKEAGKIKIAMIGMGAAGFATYRLMKSFGIDPGGIVACDSKGTLHDAREDLEERQEEFEEKWLVCRESNADRILGWNAEALRGADVCIAFSKPGPDVILPEWIASMNSDAIVFACANPVPEVWPSVAREAGARIVATGRSDFPNQVNNSLCFPGIFRGALDVRATTITDEMAMAAALELAHHAREGSMGDEKILPTMDEWQVHARQAVAAALKAQEQGVATLSKNREQLESEATKRIREARRCLDVLMKEGCIPAVPPADE